MRNLLPLLGLGICLLFATGAYADGTTDFTFTSTLGVLPAVDTFTQGSESLTITGYHNHQPSDLFAKDTSATEDGLGLEGGLDHEISRHYFVQLNLASILTSDPTSIIFKLDSIQGNDNYDIWGSNKSGHLGVLLASHQTGSSFTLPDLGQFQYISITGPKGSSVLLEDVDVTTPEISAGLSLLLGLGGLMVVWALRRCSALRVVY